MSIKVPNYIICIHNSKGTSRQRFVPRYELPLIKALWAGTAPGGKDPHISCDPINAQNQALKTVRFSEIESLAIEKKRLQHFYEAHPVTKNPIFALIFPFEGFEDYVKKAYPGLFGESEILASAEIHTEEESEQEDLLEIEVSEAIVDALTPLKHVGVVKAKALGAAGFTSISEIAQTDPDDIAAVDGITAKEAIAIVDHAVELNQDEEAEAFATE